MFVTPTNVRKDFLPQASQYENTQSSCTIPNAGIVATMKKLQKRADDERLQEGSYESKTYRFFFIHNFFLFRN